jgi:hypothetical protein
VTAKSHTRRCTVLRPLYSTPADGKGRGRNRAEHGGGRERKAGCARRGWLMLGGGSAARLARSASRAVAAAIATSSARYDSRTQGRSSTRGIKKPSRPGKKPPRSPRSFTFGGNRSLVAEERN